jgi:cytoskeletal protein CcmA (bactofilin family)
MSENVEKKSTARKLWDNFRQALCEVFAAETEAASRNYSSHSVKIQAKKIASDSNDEEMNTAWVTKSTKVVGSITTDSSIVIAGEVQGDVVSTSSVIGLGKIFGNVKCTNAELSGVYIEGYVTASEMLTVGTDSVIIGDLSANDGVIAGKVKGNIDVKSDVQIASGAIILGDISASSINVERGAVIQGSVKIRSDAVNSDNFDFTKNDKLDFSEYERNTDDIQNEYEVSL